MRSIDCEICCKKITPTSGKQKTCMADACRRELRSRYRRKRRLAQRKAPICVWCEEPILEERKRSYHAECRADKNRLRVRAYHQAKPPRQLPKRPRHYKGTVKCLYCGKRVKRTGARQITCLDQECKNARKRDRKRAAKERAARLAKLREEKLRSRKEATRRAYRVAV